MYENICVSCFRDMGNSASCPHCGYMESGRRKNAFLPARYLLRNQYLIGEVVSFDKNGICYKALDMQNRRIVEVQEYFPREIVMRDSDGVHVIPMARNFDWPTKDVQKLLDNAKNMMQFVNCPGIVNVYDAFAENRTVYIVDEYLEGMTLDAYLRAYGGRMDPETALSIIVPILDGLAQLHKANLIHRAVTPKNIIITSGNSIKLINYVFLKEASPFKESEMTVYFSPGYAPYEQYVSKERRGSYSDIYSVGAVLYKMLMGRSPQDAVERKSDDRIRETMTEAGLPEYIVLCICKAMNMNKDVRFKSAADMKNALLQKTPIVDVDGVLDKARRRRQLGLVIGLSVLLAALVAVLIIVLLQQ